MSTGGTGEESKFKKRLSQYDLRIDFNNEDYKELMRQTSQEVFDSTPMNDDVVEEGKELFENFVREEIHRHGLPEPTHCFSPVVVSTPQGYKNPLWAKTGRELREMADAFSKTKERQKVLRKANEVGVDEIDYGQFRDMLSELFACGGGITRERIVVLFFFCSDLAIRTLKEKMIDLFKRFIDWSCRYIAEKVAAWVRRHGGWGAVLTTSVEQMSKLAILVGVAILSFGLFQWLKIKLRT